MIFVNGMLFIKVGNAYLPIPVDYEAPVAITETHGNLFSGGSIGAVGYSIWDDGSWGEDCSGWKRGGGKNKKQRKRQYNRHDKVHKEVITHG